MAQRAVVVEGTYVRFWRTFPGVMEDDRPTLPDPPRPCMADYRRLLDELCAARLLNTFTEAEELAYVARLDDLWDALSDGERGEFD